MINCTKSIASKRVLNVINNTLTQIDGCSDLAVISGKLYLLVNFLANSDIDYSERPTAAEGEKYRNIIVFLYQKLYKKDPIVVFFITQLYTRRIKEYIPISSAISCITILTEGFIGPVTLQTLVFTASAIKQEISLKFITKDLFLNTDTLFHMCDYWLSFDFFEYSPSAMISLENQVFLEIAALLDCEKLIDKHQITVISLVERYMLIKMIKLLLKDSTLVTPTFNYKIIQCYGKLSGNEFFQHYSKLEDKKLETELVFSLIPIMELLDHAEENYIENDQFLNFLINGLTSLNDFLSTGDALNILKVHDILSSTFMKSKYTLVSVLEIAKMCILFYNMELLDDIHFAKFAKILPLSFYKDFLSNLPTITKHEIWNMSRSLNTFDSLGSKFINLNLCLCLIQKLIRSTWDCYNSLQVSVDMDFNLHKLIATGKFMEMYYVKQLSYTLTKQNSDSTGCYDHILIDNYRRLIFENCLETQLTIIKNWELDSEVRNVNVKEISAFVHYIIIYIWNEHEDLKLLTKSLISELFFESLAKRSTEFKFFLQYDAFTLKNLEKEELKFDAGSLKNVKISELLKSLTTEEDDLKKLDELLLEMQNNNEALVKTSQRLSLKPNSHSIYSTPANFNDRKSPTQANIDMSFRDLKLETTNMSFSNISPQSAIVHSLASPSYPTDKVQQFGRKMSTHVDSFV
ncbi:hypothetical protein QEN19_001675 [Hanseniaspora menglaensis]